MSDPHARFPAKPEPDKHRFAAHSQRHIAGESRLPAAGVKPSDPEDEEEPYIDYFYDEPGSTPGTLSIGEDASPPIIVLIDYNESTYERVQVEAPEALAPYLDSESVSWADVQGLGSEQILRRLGSVFNLHPLVLEDVVNVPQRPKVEHYDEHLLVITRMVNCKETGTGFYSEQVSFILGQHYLLTVQEEPLRDSFEPVRHRLQLDQGLIRRQGADYLAYALIDSIVDGFFPVLETYGEYIEELEEEVITNPTRRTIEKIHDIRRDLFTLRRYIWPQRDAISVLIRDGSEFVSPDVQIYLRDCYDHIIQVLDILETYRELASSLMEVYLSSVSNRMNDVMKLLTVISSIFIPLTFIAGVYGMNYNPDASPWNMPELNWYWGYPACLAVMFVTAACMVFFFWRRGWFENFSTLRR